jgi:hypothetical protein
MQTNQGEKAEVQVLDHVELVAIDGGVDGVDGGCIPDPLDKLIPKLTTFPTEQPY